MRKQFFKPGNILLFLLLLIAGSCEEKELPPPVTEDPIFTLDLQWEDGASLDLSAGENRYYLQTAFEKDLLDIVEFSGHFAQLDCLNECEPSFAIYFRDDESTPSGQADFPDFISPGNGFAFRKPPEMNFDTLVSYRVKFQSTTDPGGLPLYWIFEDTTINLIPNPEILRDNEDPFPVCLQSGNPAQGCYSENCQTVVLDNSPGFSVTITNDSNALILNAIPIGGQAPYIYQWNNGAQGPSIQVFLPGSAHCVTVTDTAGKTASTCVQAPAPGTTLCVAGFTYQYNPEFEIVPIPGDSLQLKTVVLEYIADGLVFRSDLQPQPPGAYFVIDETELYEPNENGFPTLLIRARFSGSLFGANGAVRKVEEASVVFAVAYPD